jgi:hypothetical protein
MCDYATWEKYDGTRLDLLHPSMFWDNPPGIYNVIVHPDPYMFINYPDNIIYFKSCSDEYRTNWNNKKPMAYFKGSMTGKPFDKNGEHIGRYKLMQLKMDNPDDI